MLQSMDDGVCGDGEFMEGAIILWLPENKTLTSFKHPWARSYTDGKFAK